MNYRAWEGGGVMGSPGLSPVCQKSSGPRTLTCNRDRTWGGVWGLHPFSLARSVSCRDSTALSSAPGWGGTGHRTGYIPSGGRQPRGVAVSPAHLYSQPCKFPVTSRTWSLCQQSTEGPPSPSVTATIPGRPRERRHLAVAGKQIPSQGSTPQKCHVTQAAWGKQGRR